MNFHKYADLQYNRCKNLLRYSLDVTKPLKKREQAARLYSELFIRYLGLVEIYLKMSQPKPRYPVDGNRSQTIGERGEEMAVTKDGKIIIVPPRSMFI